MIHRYENDGTVVYTDSRLQAILGPVQSFMEAFTQQQTQAPSSNPTVLALLKNFSDFASQYFAFFAVHDPDSTETAELRSQLGTVLSKIEREWANISRACEQRQVTAFADHLAKAETLAQKYYERFVGLKTPDVAPIVFFEKAYAIQRFIFTPYPLISIPLQALNDEQGWLALAHELGHYIYWNGAPLTEFESIHRAMQNTVAAALLGDIANLSFEQIRGRYQQAEIWISWLEETFADIVGTLLTGPQFALSAYRVATETHLTVKELTNNDEEHPAPAVRPFIALETLLWVMRKQKIRGSSLTSMQADFDRFFEPYQDLTLAKSDLTLSQLRAMVPAVVAAILEGSGQIWRNYPPVESGSGASTIDYSSGGQPASLSQLFKMDELQTAIAEFEQTPMSVSDLYQKYPYAAQEVQLSVKPTDVDPSAFGDLLRFLKSRLGASADPEAALRTALLELDLSQEEKWGNIWQQWCS